MIWVFVLGLIKALILIGFALQIVPGLIYLERKIAAYIQGRIGPNRVNFSIGHIRYLMPESMRGAIPESLARIKLIPGSLQPLADGIKLAFKEEIVPKNADKVLWYLAPAVALVPAATALAFIPFGTSFEFGPTQILGVQFGHHVVELRGASANIGVIGIIAVSSLAVFGVAMGGWGSGSKYPLMGAVRAAAQMISYEVALGLALVIAMVSCGSVDGNEIVKNQATTWWGLGWLMFRQPLAAMIFLVAMFAENNRLPFDLPEAEPELVGGYHTEYSGLKFGIFFLGEYTAMIVMGGLFVTLFMGGWSLPALPLGSLALGSKLVVGILVGIALGLAGLSWLRPRTAMAGGTVFASAFLFGLILLIYPGVDPHGTGVLNALLSLMVFMVKLFAVLGLMLWIRWTLPRFRYDQLMDLGWKVMVPLALVNLAVTAIIMTFWPQFRFLS